MERPLWPGVWTVYMVQYGEVLGSVAFVITPLETVSGNRLTAHNSE